MPTVIVRLIHSNTHSMAMPTRPAAIATPPAMTAMCPEVTGDAGAPPLATAADALALATDDADDKTLDEKELREADSEEASGLATSTSLVYISTTWLPTLDQNS